MTRRPWQCVRYSSLEKCLRLVADRTLDKPYSSRSKALFSCEQTAAGNSRRKPEARATVTSDGTEYVEPDRVVPPVTANSRHVPLQLADLIAAATTGAIAGNPPALELGPLLARLMHRHRLGDVNGAALVLFPDAYYNLLYHCFHETGWSKPGMMSGWLTSGNRCSHPLKCLVVRPLAQVRGQ
jgi:hypothetical protein